ncbi:MAG: FHA domain-containing protein [Verrucomicrobiota bacterium]|jgi:predicted component of type VI protein secretion system
MIQLNVLSGKKAGSRMVVRHFPFRVGRSPENHLQLDDDGIWDQHLAVELQSRGFNLAVAPNALVAVNGGPFQNQILHNGDIITIGSAKMQFWLAAARQRGLRTRELFVLALIAAITAAQFALIYWLIR